MPKFLCKQAKEMVAALITFFEQERDSIRIHRQPLLPFEAVRERVATVLNISISSVSTISEAVKNNEPLTGPKTRKLASRVTLGMTTTFECNENL